MPKKNIFISAGERSGDLHASKLMQELKLLVPNINFIGIGGKFMQDIQFNSLVNLNDISVVGFSEVLSKMSTLRSAFRKCEELFKSKLVDLVILVDFPGFNLRLASLAKRYRIPVCYYIAPQIWAWGKKRIHTIQKFVDLMIVAFPFEKEIFEEAGVKVDFFGHPLLDEPSFMIDFPELNQREQLLAILPGSRQQEIFSHLKIILGVVKLFRQNLPVIRIGISIQEELKTRKVLNEIKTVDGMVEFWESSYELMKRSKVGLIKTGTSNLEAALLGLPFVMFYKTSLLSYFLGKTLINIDHLSIVNVLFNRKIVPEYIQFDASPANLYSELKMLFYDEHISIQMQENFRSIKKMLGGPGCSLRSAEKIVKYFGL